MNYGTLIYNKKVFLEIMKTIEVIGLLKMYFCIFGVFCVIN